MTPASTPREPALSRVILKTQEQNNDDLRTLVFILREKMDSMYGCEPPSEASSEAPVNPSCMMDEFEVTSSYTKRLIIELKSQINRLEKFV